MAEPISSNSSLPWTPADPEPFDEEAGVCEDPYANAGPLAESVDDDGEGARELAARYDARQSSMPTDNNAQRTTARQSSDPYADAGFTSSGDTAFAGAAILKTHDAGSGADVEVGTVSGQIGVENETQVAMARVGDSEGRVTGNVEAFSARAHAGFRNDDGSVGLNLGIGAAAVSGEASYTTDAGSTYTFGAGASVGLSGSVGLRDADADGRDEWCFKFGGLVFTVGACVED